jgi:amino acid adenylation domain protein
MQEGMIIMPDYNSLSKYVLEELRENRIDKATAVSLLRKFNEHEEIAVVGIGCKLFDIEEYEKYWELIKNKSTAIKRCSERRIELIKPFMPPMMVKDELSYSKGVFINDLEMFDNKIFAFTDEEATAMNPGHRMIMQAAYRAMEDAGYLGEKNIGNGTGVFIGNNFTKDLLMSYSSFTLKSTRNFSFYNMLNNWSSGLATRLANIFDLKGSAYVIDASCPSSTIAIYNACQAIRNRQCTSALAGGMLIDLTPLQMMNSTGWIFQHDDKAISRSYDDNVGGSYIGEGAGLLYLKPLSKAINDGDRIHGIISWAGINCNGSNGAYTQSSVEDIKNVVISTIKEAKVEVTDIDLLVGEGYTNKFEEGLELSGLIAGFSNFTNRKQFCGLSSITANIGYLQSAIGVFNMTKVILAMKDKTIPPLHHFVEPTDMINFGKSPFYVSDMAKPWTADDGKPRMGAVYSYGYGGNNLLTILREAPEQHHQENDERQELFLLTAKSEYSFNEYLKSYIEFLGDESRNISFTDMCYTASVCRPLYSEYRLAVIAKTRDELLEKLVNFSKKRISGNGIFVSKNQNDNQNKKRKLIYNEIEGKKLNEIAAKFCEGQNFMFSKLFENMKPLTEDVPRYPFDKKKFWIKKLKFSLLDMLRQPQPNQQKGEITNEIN